MNLPRTPASQTLVGSGVRTSLVMYHGRSASNWKGGWDGDTFLVGIGDFLARGYVTCTCWGFAISCCSFWHLVACQQMSTRLTDYPFVKMEVKCSMWSLCLYYPRENQHGTWKSPAWKGSHLPNLHFQLPSSFSEGCIYLPKWRSSMWSLCLPQYFSPAAEKSHHGTTSVGAAILVWEARRIFSFRGM